ncbi:UPF0187 protein [Rhizoctonia solani AG-1 IB]|uniref:UPF0187 protein n=1 Tax=Thanatephorus cucumeris (strain AG1-IB / isolate 7/3/14) TaxID=1108050 RepID=A0A0B7FFF0_THACB|nr:UPF0187 protein [Rhizoctonia solani AG-1 IB]
MISKTERARQTHVTGIRTGISNENSQLSEWVALLESRGSAGGSTIGGILGCIAAFEDQLTGLEKILTTPLPFVYSAHIRHTVWLYLFFLPFQLTQTFGYWTIFGVGTAAFMFLGLLAAGEEIEQPFGYDENDLDLDLFVTDIIQFDLRTLTEMWPHGAELKGASTLGGGEIRRVADAPVGWEVDDDGCVQGNTHMTT